MVGPGGGGGERGGRGKSRKRKRENEREREKRGGGFTSIYAAVTRGARKERGRGGEKERKEGLSQREHYITSLAAILDHPSRCQSIKNMKFF